MSMAGGRPSKPLQLVTGHRTKAEKKTREKAEAELLTGKSLKETIEVRNNPVAHAEFMRIKKLLKAIKKDDDLSGNIINTHCLLFAECKEFEELKTRIYGELSQLQEAYERKEIDFLTLLEQKDKLQNRLMSCDKKIMDKRKMILDIAKENIMTIQSALRSVPKKELKREKTPMERFLEKRNGGNA
jgi:hypothetical protein